MAPGAAAVALRADAASSTSSSVAFGDTVGTATGQITFAGASRKAFKVSRRTVAFESEIANRTPFTSSSWSPAWMPAASAQEFPKTSVTSPPAKRMPRSSYADGTSMRAST